MPLSKNNYGQSDQFAAVVTPTVTCEYCGTTGLANRMINFKLIIGSPGHESLPPIDCMANQGPTAFGHWICGKESCFDATIQACKEQHVKAILDNQHATVTDGSSVWQRGV